MNKKDPREVSTESLSSLDEYGDRNFLYPAEVKGFFKKWRNVIHPIFIAFFLILPWIKVNGQQWVLLNLPERKFHIFGLSFWAHDTPIIFFVIAGSLVGFSLITAIWGRLWCGWACPQTVFIESVFRRIEILVEGNYLERRKLAKSPLSFSKFIKTLIKWSLFLMVSLILTHSFLAYFVGSDRLIEMIQHNPNENWTNFLIICFTTGVILFDFGWFREQFCLIMCPYGRFQSVLMDKDSLAVLYDTKRGEPRRSKENKDQLDKQGDCVNCFRCVSVCPTGIDIRNGLQMECIACTACIDACDDIMEKLKKPKGLIRYASEASLTSKSLNYFRPRTLLYTFILIFLALGFVFTLIKKEPIDFIVIRAIEEPYKIVTGADGKKEIINHFKVHIQNQSSSQVITEYKIKDKDSHFLMIAPDNPATTNMGQKKWIHFFIKVDDQDFKSITDKSLQIEFKTHGTGLELNKIETITLLGPE
ncbi:MAG: cytochrome c oxidase accessory protein CcoG [Bdellovibrionaceae bacterium]|nr:cytochrome c oxidase accessory protein CcoG [Pseudobdellovibrionaceae bacterium]